MSLVTNSLKTVINKKCIEHYETSGNVRVRINASFGSHLNISSVVSLNTPEYSITTFTDTKHFPLKAAFYFACASATMHSAFGSNPSFFDFAKGKHLAKAFASTSVGFLHSSQNATCAQLGLYT